MNPFKATNPLTVTKDAFALAGAAVGLAGTVAREAVHAGSGLTRGAIHLARRRGSGPCWHRGARDGARLVDRSG